MICFLSYELTWTPAEWSGHIGIGQRYGRSAAGNAESRRGGSLGTHHAGTEHQGANQSVSKIRDKMIASW